MSVPAAPPLLDVRDLTVDFLGAGAPVRAVKGVDIAIAAGETFALVGESGSGKSATSLAIMGLLDPRRAKVGGEISLCDEDGPRDLLGLDPQAMRRVRGGRIAMVFQEPMTSLNPVHTVGAQIGEALRLHQKLTSAQAKARVIDGLAEVGIPDPRRRASAYPHELSGGMRQRVLIAMALACRPRLLIADEPTTALDATVQIQILELLKTLQRAHGMAVLFVTHNLAVVAEIADRVGVMYGGRIVETAPAAELFARPRHPYTRGLLDSLPGAHGGVRGGRLKAIAGSVVDPRTPPPGCAFHPRCGWVAEPCRAAAVPLMAVSTGRDARCLRWAEL
jgi:oligopeptide/dipeptide ABC transporter ATP-binding protein